LYRKKIGEIHVSPLALSTVNNVGVSHEIPADFVDTSPEELDSIINVNVTATLRITSLIAPSMVSRCVTRPLPFILRQVSLDAPRSRTDFTSKKGLILNMGSFAGAAPTPMLAVYSGSKAYLHTWSDALTAELAPKGVVVEHVNTYYVVRRVLLYISPSLFLPPSPLVPFY